MPNIFLGIDPGATGGLVAFDGKVIHSAVKMPQTEEEILRWVKRWTSYPVFCRAVIEKVGGYIPRQRRAVKAGESAEDLVDGQPGSSMFNFGMNYGALRMALVAADLVEGVSFFAVAPQTWQAKIGIYQRDKSETRSSWKGRLKAAAQFLYPEVKVTLNIADAILLATYCWQTHSSGLNTCQTSLLS